MRRLLPPRSAATAAHGDVDWTVTVTAALPHCPGLVDLETTKDDLELGRWWLVLTDDDVEVCQEDHGLDVDVTIIAEIRPFIRLWRGDAGWDEGLRGGDLRLVGPTHLRRQVPDWLELSHFATVDRAPAEAISTVRG